MAAIKSYTKPCIECRLSGQSRERHDQFYGRVYPCGQVLMQITVQVTYAQQLLHQLNGVDGLAASV